jgi:hypothetical protein
VLYIGSVSTSHPLVYGCSRLLASREAEVRPEHVFFSLAVVVLPA